MSITNPLYSHTSIRDLDFTRMTTNCLMADGISTLGDLLKHSERHLGKIPGLGRISVNKLKARLTELGLTLQPN